ncbi:MAG TPA: hypothetical protein H9756_09370, partial [Candidatus Mediterraneibacter gallistercoris]|nr:hypothetical protein [Candidatus Mediterraneibacter gallistercoris]
MEMLLSVALSSVQPRQSQNRTLCLPRLPPLFSARFRTSSTAPIAKPHFVLTAATAAVFRALPHQFSRAIRKTALRAYCGYRRCFAHILALSPCVYLTENLCKHSFLARAYAWLNWCYTLNLNSMISPS